ncbi:MAG: hypothetical protein DRN27_08090, partial [Thermoplasmata archaeon]
MSWKKILFISIVCIILFISVYFILHRHNQSRQEPVVGSGNNVVTVTAFYDNRVTDEQIDFANTHYDFIAVGNAAVYQDRIQGPLIFQYQNLLQYKATFGFDQNHVYSNENMFCHNSSSTQENNRIIGTNGVWLMDRTDLVDENNPNALDHWVNYFAEVAKNTINTYNLDGLLIDLADNKINENNFGGLLPDNFSQERWKQATRTALQYIKTKLSDKLVVFNGVGWYNDEEQNLNVTDGGLWEVWAFRPTLNRYLGEEEWKRALEMTQQYKDNKKIVLVSKKPGLTEDIQTRMFLLSSYLLVNNKNVSLQMIDYSYSPNGKMQYYPEYDIDLGMPLGDYTEHNGIYKREFEKGIVLVNPDNSQSKSYSLDKEYSEVNPVGGGYVKEDGSWDGYLTYEPISNQ